VSQARILIVRVGAMGDVLHALPAVTGLRHLWPNVAVDWVVDPRWAPLLVDETGQGPLVSSVLPAHTKQWSRMPLSRATLRSIAGLRQALRAGRYRYVIDVQGTLRSAVIGRMAESENFAGFAEPRERAAAWLYRQTFPRRGTHVVQQNAALLSETIGAEITPATPALPVSAPAALWAEQTVASQAGSKRLAILAPTAGWGAKQWSAERFGALALELSALGFHVVVNAASASDSVGLEVVRASAGTASVLPCDVARLVALTRRAALVVGGDSGPVHLAAALGRPVVALFGPTNPDRNGPWGPGPVTVLRDPSSVTTYKRTALPDPGLASISVQAVVEAVQAVVPTELEVPQVCENG
jgi:heptosyltransferase I